MSCGCSSQTPEQAGGKSTRSTPTTQCLLCAQKHADEAMIAMREFTYEVENRSFIHGSLRAIVLHTYKVWRDIAETARKAALAWQNGDMAEAESLLKSAIEMIYARLDHARDRH